MGNKIITVIASILKPVDDTRMYEKIGLSLQQTNRYAVNIIGFESKNLPKHSEIAFHPAFSFSNKSWKRLFATLKLLKYLYKIYPKLIITTTFEVLIAAVIFKITNRSKDIKIVYDVQENYALNFLTNRKKNIAVKLIFKLIRWIEKISQRFISLNILAEKFYTKEISFISNHTLVIPNAFKVIHYEEESIAPLPSIFLEKRPKIIFNGTISEIYGIEQSLEFATALHDFLPELLLIIVGHVTNTKLLNKLLNYAKSKSYIYTFVSKNPLPHNQILDLVRIADFGIVAHQPVESIKNCFPTRIYEYMALQKPFFLQKHPYWTNYCDPWNCSINLDFNDFDAEKIAMQLDKPFYPSGTPDDIFWEKYEALLIQEIDKVTRISI
ncbi:hypothetical protein WJR50_18450 [Catalinimonas sp. 4WD22]|uniref:hypothetical protein n=1 Tax=Catalinimonas locisalis TaxID=3133978 RepID=UPI003101A339